MARVNLERRAEIGLAKRNRTRAAILEAARACYAAVKAAPVTVDAVMQAAGLAKGTFYVHFADLGALEAALGETLTEELDRRLQPALQHGMIPHVIVTWLARRHRRGWSRGRQLRSLTSPTPCRRTCARTWRTRTPLICWRCRRSNWPRAS